MAPVWSLVCATLALVLGSASGIDTVPVDLDKYVGRWYQTYADKFVFSTYEKNAYCATADYGLNDDGSISVLNNERKGAVDGPYSNVTGVATPTDEPGKYMVSFVDGGVPFPQPYWVVALGPVVDDEYQYAVVTDNKQRSLFVLARDVEDYYATYDDEVKTTLTDLGFTGFLNTPVTLPQEGCTYPAPTQDGCNGRLRGCSH